MKEKIQYPDLHESNFSNQSGLYTRLDIKDKDQFQKTLEAMNICGISPEEQENVFKVVSAVLHFGNLNFERKTDAEDDSTFSRDRHTQKTVEIICELLGFSKKYFEQTLCTRSMSTGKAAGMFARLAGRAESVERAHTVHQAKEAVESLAMTLYHRLFYWIVWKVNLKVGEVGEDSSDIRRRLSEKLEKLNTFMEMSKRNKKLKTDVPLYIRDYSIGLLDIFGFEVFETNGFNQLCINYANEVLQQQFNTFVFKDEQKFYQSEGIDWKEIEFPDNLECIQMIEGAKKKVGLLKLIDEECLYPKGSDTTLHAKLFKHLAVELDMKTLKEEKAMSKIKHMVTNSFVQARKSGRFTVDFKTQQRQRKFSISHFAGDVEYEIDGFYAMNKDELRREAVGLLRGAKNKFVRILLPADAMNGPQDSSQAGKYFQDVHEKAKRRQKSAAAKKKTLMRGSMERHIPTNVANQKLQQKTVGKQFKDQLYLAMKHICSSQPHYIRCIKPNDDTDAKHFNRVRVLEQLNYSGVLEVVRVARAGYSTRLTHADFLSRFKCVALQNSDMAKFLPQKGNANPNILRKSATDILNLTELTVGENYQVGNSMVLFRASGFLELESLRQKLLTKFIVAIQIWFRYILQRRRALAKTRGMIALQKEKREAEKRAKIKAELLKKKAEEEELRQKMEALRIQKEAEEKERHRLEEIERFRLEKIKQEKERKELLERQTKSAIKMQSFVRLIQAQKRANALFEEKVERAELIAEAANIIIDLFRENARRNQLRRAEQLEDLQEIERLKKARIKAERKRIRKRRKQAEILQKQQDTLMDTAISVGIPLLCLVAFMNPTLMFYAMGIIGSIALGVTLQTSLNQHRDYVDRKEKKWQKKRRKLRKQHEKSISDSTVRDSKIGLELGPLNENLNASDDVLRVEVESPSRGAKKRNTGHGNRIADDNQVRTIGSERQSIERPDDFAVIGESSQPYRKKNKLKKFFTGRKKLEY